MSSNKIPQNENQQSITRNKQSRRKMLKSIAAGSGAVVAGASLPDQWAKPMVDSVLLPAHANASGPASCAVGGSILATYIGQDDGGSADVPEDVPFDPYPIPGDYEELFSGSSDGTISIVPQISVTPGVTDNFTLNSDIISASGNVSNPADLAQATVSPDPANGAIPFNTIAVNSQFFKITMTLTPDNGEFCGAPQVIDITFND